MASLGRRSGAVTRVAAASILEGVDGGRVVTDQGDVYRWPRVSDNSPHLPSVMILARLDPKN